MLDFKRKNEELVQQHHQEIEKLQSELSKSETRDSSHRNHIEELETGSDRGYGKELEDAQAKEAKQTTEIQRLNEQIAELKKDYENKLKLLEEETQANKNEFDNQFDDQGQPENQDTNRELSKLRDENQELQQDLEESMNRIRELEETEQERDFLHLQNQKLAKEVSQLRKNEASSPKNTFGGNIQMVQLQLAEQQERYNALNDQYMELKVVTHQLWL